MFCGTNQSFMALVIGLVLVSPCVVTATVIPLLNCYSINSENRLYDLTSLYGREFEQVAGTKTYTLRFCKDFQERSQEGYISFGSYDSGISSYDPSTGASFVHDYRRGDLRGCEHHGAEFNGREAEVSVICGTRCPNAGACANPSGCICSVTLDTTENPCVATVVLAVPCPEPGPKVVKGFTIGFSPRGKEVVANGFTQWGFENDEHRDYRFDTSQSKVFFYFSAPTQVAKEIGKPTTSLSPSKGLDVQLSGTAASGVAPTTLAPSLLEVNWRCETAATYLVNVTVPVKGYDSVVFSLLKLCESTQTKAANASSGWATFGVLSCIFFVVTTMCCCGGFLYGTRVENKRGLEALPGIGLLATCLEVGSRDGGGYSRADEGVAIITDRPLRDGSSANSRGGQRDGRYGSV